VRVRVAIRSSADRAWSDLPLQPAHGAPRRGRAPGPHGGGLREQGGMKVDTRPGWLLRALGAALPALLLRLPHRVPRVLRLLLLLLLLLGPLLAPRLGSPTMPSDSLAGDSPAAQAPPTLFSAQALSLLQSHAKDVSRPRPSTGTESRKAMPLCLREASWKPQSTWTTRSCCLLGSRTEGPSLAAPPHTPRSSRSSSCCAAPQQLWRSAARLVRLWRGVAAAAHHHPGRWPRPHARLGVSSVCPAPVWSQWKYTSRCLSSPIPPITTSSLICWAKWKGRAEGLLLPLLFRVPYNGGTQSREAER